MKPNAFRHLELWLVGFRYIYFYECVIEKQVFLGRLKGIWSFTALPNLRVRLHFYYRTHVIKGNQETDEIFLAFFWKVSHNFSTLDGIYHPYLRYPDGRFSFLDLPNAEKFEYFFVHGINDAWALVARAKPVDSVPRTSVGTFQHGLHELQVPGSVSTEGWNINQDGSIVGHYDSADGRRHGFIARSVAKAESDYFSNTYTV